MTGSLTDNREENDNAGDCRVGGRHSGVILVKGGHSSVGGAIQRLEVGD